MRKRSRSSSIDSSAIVDVFQREVGLLSSRNFSHRLRASQDLVLRLEVYRNLEKHRGCVNTISFNQSGDILASGSDDRRVILWDWETGNAKLSFHSGHRDNVFQAKFMPFTDDHSIVTCAADGQVRHAQIQDGGGVKTELLGKHQGRAHKLAVEPGSPHIFYTCGEDGLVFHFDLRTRSSTVLFTCQPTEHRSDLPVVHLNAITIDPRNPNLFAIAGSDEYARLYDVRKCRWDGSTDFGCPTDYFCPPHLIADDGVSISGLSFSDQSELLVSYINESIYLFSRDMGLGPNLPSTVHMDDDASGSSSKSSQSSRDSENDTSLQVYKGHQNRETVKGVRFFGPKCEYVVSGSDCGRIFIWKKKGGQLVRVMEGDKDVVNCIEPHPYSPVLASSGIESDIKIWTPKAIDRAVLPTNLDMVKPRSRFWMFPSPPSEDLLVHLYSLLRRRVRSEQNGESSDQNGESSVAGRILEHIWAFNPNDEELSDDGDAP